MKTETVPTAAHSFPGPFGVVTLMEDPLEAIFDLAETLLNLDLQDTNECRVVHCRSNQGTSRENRQVALRTVSPDASQHQRGVNESLGDNHLAGRVVMPGLALCHYANRALPT